MQQKLKNFCGQALKYRPYKNGKKRGKGKKTYFFKLNAVCEKGRGGEKKYNRK